MLNLYLGTMTEIALSYGATVDKYIGDAIMLFFGDPESKGVKEDAINCVNMALEMHRMARLQMAGFAESVRKGHSDPGQRGGHAGTTT